jgi:hypothetical protein
MRKLVVVAPVVAALALALLVPRGTSAPALADKPVRYQYAQLRYTCTYAALPGNPAPGAPPAPSVAVVSVRWATVDDLVEGKDWANLGDKLKAPAAKRVGPLAQTLRVLDRLGADGWEVYEHSAPTSGDADTWWLKRRLP